MFSFTNIGEVTYYALILVAKVINIGSYRLTSYQV